MTFIEMLHTCVKSVSSIFQGSGIAMFLFIAWHPWQSTLIGPFPNTCRSIPTTYLFCSILLHSSLHPGARASRQLLKLLLGQLGHLEGLVLGGDIPALLEPRPLKQTI